LIVKLYIWSCILSKSSQMKPRILLLAVLLCISQSAIAQHLSASNYNLHRAPAFLENKGQVVDQNDHPRKDVKFIYDNQKGLKLILKDHSFCYEVYAYEKQPKKNISEATGQPIESQLPDKFKEPDPVTVMINRIDVELKGSNAHPEIISEGKSADYVNYYKEYTGENGITDIHYYSKVTYRNIYKNIDFIFLAQEDGSVKYNIIVHPGGRLSDVKLVYAGMKNISSSGNKISIETALGGVEESIPLSYIQETGERVKVRYNGKGKIGFEGDNEEGTLVVDPFIEQWGTYYSGSDRATITTDAADNVYLGGSTFATGGIASSGAYKTTISFPFSGTNYMDAYLVKFDKNGKRLWGTYYGGTGQERSCSSVTDSVGNVYLAGETSSLSGIASSGAFQTSRGNVYSTSSIDAFLAKFDSSGKRLWSTYYGGDGNDFSSSVAIDRWDNVILGGSTSGSLNMATKGSYQDTTNVNSNAFVVKFSSSGERIWATYYTGIGDAMAVDRKGNVYLAGETDSKTDVATANAFQKSFASNGVYTDDYLVKFDSSGKKRLWGTYYGGDQNEMASALVTDTSDNVYLMGVTYGSSSGIASAGAYQTAPGSTGKWDIFLAKFDSLGSRKWATYYGGSGDEFGYSLALDKERNIYAAGMTSSTNNIAATDAYANSYSGSDDAFMVKFDKSGSLQWGSYFGGSELDYGYSIATDKSSDIYLAGATNSQTDIATSNGFQTSYGYNYLVKFSYVSRLPDAGIISIDSVPASSCSEEKAAIYVRIKNFSSVTAIASLYAGWSVDGIKQTPVQNSSTLAYGDTSAEIKIGAYTFAPGTHRIKVWTYAPNGITDKDFTNDTMQLIIVVYAPPQVSFTTTNTCLEEAVSISMTPDTIGQKHTFFWDFGDGSTSSDSLSYHTYSKSGIYTITLTTTSSQGCISTVSKQVQVHPRSLPSFSAKPICYGDTSHFSNKSTITEGRIKSYLWKLGDGTTDTAQNPSHLYSSAGSYVAKLYATTEFGCTDSVSDTVKVYGIPKVYVRDTSLCAGKTFPLIADVTDAAEFRWYINGSFISGDSILWQTYTTPGKYKVALAVKNYNGCSDSVHVVITILPVPAFTATVHAISDSARFVVNDSSSSDTYFWDFGDGNTSTDRNAVHVYSKDSLYSVKLTVTNKQGCQSFYTQQLGIHTGMAPIVFPSMKLLLYPNPAQDQLTIQCTGENCEERLHLSIISMDGKTLLQDEWKGEALHAVNVSALCPGTYLVRINNGKEQSVQSLIKE
jgi:PKD repeat protein